MAIPQLTPEQIDQISELVARYITHQRERYAPRSAPMPAQQRLAMAGFFSPRILDNTRLLELQRERVPNPDFYPMLRGLGFNILPNQSTMAAITFSDVIVAHEPFSNGLLFHELVHAEQYRQLGVLRFAVLYVHGFLMGGRYEAMPLEVNAYSLGERYEAGPERPFPVENEVRRLLAEGRF